KTSRIRLSGPPLAEGPSTKKKRELATMFITKMSLPRRTFLRGMGVTLALPLLESMVPALTALASTAANPQRRFGAIFVPLGERPGYWTPKTVGANFDFAPIL